MSSSPRLPRKPEARTEKVEDLVERVRRGQVRIPSFQRGLRWNSDDVIDLFDSIYRGYPVGALLFYKRPAAAGRVPVGPLLIEAEEASEAWWVIDGQQRLTALTACLRRPLPIPTRPSVLDPYCVYYAARNQRFEAPSPSGEVALDWVALPLLLDASRLAEWVFQWKLNADPALRHSVFEAGARLREFEIPLYLIETEDQDVAEQIYYRTNNAGKKLEWTEIHKALFGGDGARPSTLRELADDLVEVGMGTLPEKRLLTCLFALRGLDPTRTFADHYRRDPQALSGAVQQALPVLRRVLSFLRHDAGIPHLRLLPKPILLDILTLFFFRVPEPKPRTRSLLARWFWRTVLGAGKFNDRTLRRRGIAAVRGEEEQTVQALLRLVEKQSRKTLELPQSFDARADESRLVLLALAHLEPRHLMTGELIDLVTLLDGSGQDAFARIVQEPALERALGVENRLLHPVVPDLWQHLRYRLTLHGENDTVLRSHGVNEQAAAALSRGDGRGFLACRASQLEDEARELSSRMAAWEHPDRPSLDHLLAEPEET